MFIAKPFCDTFSNKSKQGGIELDVQKSDGAAIGFNKDSTTKNKIRYVWYASQEGTFLFNDMTDMGSHNDTHTIRGLFGALIVEPKNATWTDPITGEELKSGTEADIHVPKQPDFREFVPIFHDEAEVYECNGMHPISPITGLSEGTMPINYRAEPARIRMPEGMMTEDNEDCCSGMGGMKGIMSGSMNGMKGMMSGGMGTKKKDNDPCRCAPDTNGLGQGIVGEEGMMGSWSFGDPDTPIFRAYVGDPVRIRLVHGGIKETHVFHMHAHQWCIERTNSTSMIVDSISFSPQTTHEIELLFGAGSFNKTVGDMIWHCHLYPHFAEGGMWGLLRVFDRIESGGRVLPSGVITEPLIPLPDRKRLPEPDELHPGFPLFVSGEFGKKAFKPPLGIIGEEFRPLDPLEEANSIPPVESGRIYSMPIPEKNIKEFDIVAIQLPLIYNRDGWFDPQGRIFVLAEDEEAILSGQKKPEPLYIRVNAGDKMRIRFTNKLPIEFGGTPFQVLQQTTEAGFHIHLVKFDVITSDGSANGWNNDCSAIPNDTVIEVMFADEELGATFFHDHLFANAHQQHGLFGGLIVEPKGSVYLDPKTREPIKCGSQAIIKTPKGEFREFCMHVHDFAFLFDKDGNPLNPPKVPSDPADPGVMGVNYTNEPLHFRQGDPAYVFSSFVHGDPFTPLLQTYAGDPIRFRLFDGAHEEQHSFNLHGLKWHREPFDLGSPFVQQQTQGISTTFNLFINDDYGAGDYMYNWGNIDDIWLGLWGILRAHDQLIDTLAPLKNKGQRKLPNRVDPLPQKTGNPPPKAILPEIPKKRPVKKYNISAIQRDIIYNDFGDHDPDGLIFVSDDLLPDIINGNRPIEPLIIRANKDDFIEVTLTNRFDKPINESIFPRVPVQEDFPPSNRVSIHPQLVKYDVLNSDGATIGFNPDQTIAPNESITYRWFADEAFGVCGLTGFGDLYNHRRHGLFGALIIEPKGSILKDANTNKKIKKSYDNSVIVKYGGEQFREFVLFIQDGIRLLDKNDVLIPDAIDPMEDELDNEDSGQKGFNYRSEAFRNRLANNPDPHLVMNSLIHGDPATPVFKAFTNESIRIRLVMLADKPRNHSFVLHGHSWDDFWNDPNSLKVWATTAISNGTHKNLHFDTNSIPGDYSYRSGIYRYDLEQGMWGILRLIEGTAKK